MPISDRSRRHYGSGVIGTASIRIALVKGSRKWYKNRQQIGGSGAGRGNGGSLSGGRLAEGGYDFPSYNIDRDLIVYELRALVSLLPHPTDDDDLAFT